MQSKTMITYNFHLSNIYVHIYIPCFLCFVEGVGKKDSNM